MFQRQPAGRTMVRVCSAPVCALAGADVVAQALCRHLQIEPGAVSSDGAFTVEYSSLPGLVRPRAGAARERNRCWTCRSRRCGRDLRDERAADGELVGGDIRILTSNCGQGHPTSLADYQARGGCAGLKNTLTMTPRAVLAE